MRINRISLAAAALYSSSLVNAQAINPVTTPNASAPNVNLGYAKFQGYTNQTAGINYFRGLQYAANPTGALRWQKPVPIEKNNTFKSGTVYNATVIAPSCYQTVPEWINVSPNALAASTPQGYSENCLIVDVLIPEKPVSKKLPVMVQIHGGGYTEGDAQWYPGDAMVNFSNGTMMYVSMQYRLGIFGFLAGKEIAANGVMNAGLLDQRAALEWVQNHIAAFGGDPNRVTIWGGSAGGGSVTMQLTAGGAQDKPPFSAAIAEYPWWQPLLNATGQETQYNNALKLSNCTNTACLRALSSDALQSLNNQVEAYSYLDPGYGYGVFYYGPVVDGTFVKTLPGLAFQQGNFYHVPLLVDHDAYEGADFSNSSMTNQVEETMDAQALFPFAGPAFFSRLYQLYPASEYTSTFNQRQTWFGDFIISCPTYYMAYNAVERNTNSSAVFKLTFAAGSELHGATVPFLCSNVIGWPGANNQTLAQIMSSYWISFAVNHDPNPTRIANAPFWPSYVAGGNGTSANGESVGFDTLAVTFTTVSPAPDPDADEKCEFFGNNGFVVSN